ncbi:MAG: ribonuclease J [Candidatus Margulisiibacteriota bacterium]
MEKQPKKYFKKPSKSAPAVQIIPLGGLDGIGRNMQVIRYKDDIIIIDAGMMFPDDTMLGIDKVIPDMTYIRENKDKVRAIILTHGHEDHIGALSFLCDEVHVPIYATRLTMGLAENKLRGHQKKGIKKVVVSSRQKVDIGPFNIEFIQVNHSIPDGVGLAIRTPAGIVVHTGDFKIDHTPVDGKVIDLSKFAELGDEGVLVLMSDSTNADDEGYTLSERVVGETFDRIFKQVKGRIIIATFASNIHRIQQAIDVSIKCGRKFVLMGKSMEENGDITHRLGYLKYPEGSRLTIEDTRGANPNLITVITTGSQGEPMSALTKMAKNEFKHLKVTKDDTIIISAIPIPGNEKAVIRNVDNLFKLGANVIYEADSDVHVSGHAKREEQKIMLNLVKPKYFIPIHGEYRHLKYHASIAESMGMAPQDIFVAENGDIMEFSKNGARIAGKTNGGAILVDGLGRGEHDSIVLQDRRILSREGILTVNVVLSLKQKKLLSDPVIKSRGFIYMEESDELIIGTIAAVKKKVGSLLEISTPDMKKIKRDLKNYLRDYLYDQTHRRPILLVVVTDI